MLLQLTPAAIALIRKKASEQPYPKPVKYKAGFNAENPPQQTPKRKRPPYIPGVTKYTDDELDAAF